MRLPFIGKKGPRPNRRVKAPNAGERRRLFVSGIKAAVLLAFVTGAFYGAYSLYRELKRTPSLDIKTVLVKGKIKMTEEEAVMLAGVRPGVNMLSFDVKAAEAGLKTHPFVKAAKVTRRLPDTVEIALVEYQPAAFVSADEMYVMDGDGVIFKRYASADALDLPVVTSLVPQGPEWDGSYRAGLLKLLGALKKGDGAHFAGASEIHVEPVYGFSVVTVDGAVRIELGFDGFEEKLERLRKVGEARNWDFKGVESIDLNNERGVVVKFTGAPRKEGGST